MAEHPHPPKPTRVTVGRVLIGIAVIVVVIAAGQQLAPMLPQTEKWIEAQGIWAPVYYILLVCVLTLFCVPLDLLLIAAGIMFPLGWGFLYITLALYISQSIIFWVSRLILHGRVQRLVDRNPKLRIINKAIDHGGVKLLLLVRMAPIPASPVSYLMGASSMQFWRFTIANAGLVPVAFVSQYFGYAAAHATRTTHDPHHSFSVHDALVYGGFILALIVVILIGHTARKALKAVENEDDST